MILTAQTKLVLVFDAVTHNFWPSDVQCQIYLQFHEHKVRVHSSWSPHVFTTREFTQNALLQKAVVNIIFDFQGSGNCTRCANFQDGLFCVSRCPQGVPGEDETLVWKYADNNKVCQLCHKNCTQG